MSQSKLPAIISAVMTLAVLGLLGWLLYTRSGSVETTASVPDTGATDIPPIATPLVTPVATMDTAPVTTEEQPAPAGERQTYSAPPPMIIDPTNNYTATITTPRGDIVIRLLPEIAPQTVNNFVFLAREGFYDGLTWHRVIEGFMAQGGDPEGTGMGGPGYTIPAEFTDQVLFDRPGIVAMARRGNDINSAGSQFFITTAPAPTLNNQYTIFGVVVEGQEIVNNIPLRDPATATQPGEQMLSVTITEGS